MPRGRSGSARTPSRASRRIWRSAPSWRRGWRKLSTPRSPPPCSASRPCRRPIRSACSTTRMGSCPATWPSSAARWPRASIPCPSPIPSSLLRQCAGNASRVDDLPGSRLTMARLNMVKALNLALMQEMERDRDIVIIGEDVGVDGGVFRVTDDLQRTFGSQRVIDSPLAEAAIVGASVGMALYGLKPICEIQFSGFAFQCFHQIENHAARYRMRSQGRFHCAMVIRMPYGGGVRALEHHSESEEQFYASIPGLKMVIPSGPRTARGLLVSAIRDPDPVVFFEAKALYHAGREEVSDEI